MSVLNLLKEKIIDVSYYSFVEPDEFTPASKVPALKAWSFTNFTSHHLVLQLNFSNPLYVSSSTTDKDQVSLEIMNHKIFVAEIDRETVSENYTLSNFTVPS